MSDHSSDQSVAVLDAARPSPEQLEVAAWLQPSIKLIKRRLASNDQGIELLQRHMGEIGAVFRKMLEQQTVKGKKKAKRRLKPLPSAAELDRYRDERLKTVARHRPRTREYTSRSRLSSIRGSNRERY